MREAGIYPQISQMTQMREPGGNACGAKASGAPLLPKAKCPALSCLSHLRHLWIIICVLGAAPAQAAPPPVGSEDWELMHPFVDWVTSQHDQKGFWCCDIGDGRPTEACVSDREPKLNANNEWDCPHGDGGDDAWWVHIDPVHWQGDPSEQFGVINVVHWARVPADKVTKGGNPTGVPILWLLHGNVQCFAPPGGV
jgi:hypothetical protein